MKTIEESITSIHPGTSQIGANSSFKDNILDLLAPLKLYNLNLDSGVYKEISVYSNALESILNNVNNLLGEAFIQTATNEGLCLREQLLNLDIDPSTPMDRRRDQILYALAVQSKNFNMAGMINSLKSVGLDASISEDVQKESITISGNPPANLPFKLSKIKTDAIRMLPAHLEIAINIGEPSTWCKIEDSLNSTVDSDQNVSWDELESSL